MAAPAHFDTLDYAKKLQSAGVPSEQAELHARALAEALGTSVASRSDVAAVGSEVEGLRADMETMRDNLRAEMSAMRDSLRTEIASVRNELKLDLGGRIDTLKWMVTFFGAVNVGILVKLLVSGP